MNTPYYFSEISKKYEINYLNFHGYNFIRDLSYTKNDSRSIILLFEKENNKILRGYQDGIIFPELNYFNMENIHVNKKQKKIQEVFDYIFSIFEKYKIVNTKIYQDPYLCFKLGYSIFNLIDTKFFNHGSSIDICVNYSKNTNINFIEKEMESGGARTVINGFKKNPVDVVILSGTIDDLLFDAFVKKHLMLAGRKTKPDYCWNMIKDMIKNREAILVYYQDNYILFHSSFNYSYYGINACTKKDKIITYLLYKGIQWLITNKCEFIHFGKFYKYFEDDKNINISKFKKSFCNKMFTQYYLDS